MDEINYVVIGLAFLFGIIIWLSFNNLDIAVIFGVGFMLILALILFFLEKFTMTSQNTGTTPKTKETK